MTAPSQAVERSLPHDMIAWKAAAEDLAAQRDLLAHRVEQLEAALRFYADEQRYRGSNRPPIPGDPYSPPELTSYMYDIHRDDGAIARAALANSLKESA